MEFIKECREKISKSIKDIDIYINKHKDELGFGEQFMQTQSIVGAALADKDLNLRRIIEHQGQLKYIIEIDQRIESLKRSNREDRLAIDRLRRECAKLSIDAIKEKTLLIEVQQKEAEQYRMEQMRSIVEDYNRHEKLVDIRKREIDNLKKTIENEAANRPALLKSVEESLQRSLRNRAENRGGSNELPKATTEPETIELTSIDEYELYSKKKATPASGARKKASQANNGPKRGGSSAGGRGRKRGGAAGNPT